VNAAKQKCIILICDFFAPQGPKKNTYQLGKQTLSRAKNMEDFVFQVLGRQQVYTRNP
jgi:N-acetylglucosamine-6-phosphate deacetylase